MKRRVLLSLWCLTFVLALGSSAIFVRGLIRDYYTGDAVVRFDPGQQTDWTSDSFRVWGQGSYALRLSSVNHDPVPVGRRLASRFEVLISNPHGKTVLQKTYGPDSIEHRVPDNYADTLLETLELNDWPLRSWRLQLRVINADPNFKTSRTELRLRKQRYDPGMGGLANYVMIVPAAVLLLVSFILALFLARAGTSIPLYITAAGSLAFIVLLV